MNPVLRFGCSMAPLHSRHTVSLGDVMTVRNVFAGIAAAAFLLARHPAQAESHVGLRPHVLFIVADDLNDAISDWGGVPAAPTPNVDRLSAIGVSFRNAHVNSPICLPSRNSFLSGMHPARLGHYRINDNTEEIPLLKQAVYLPRFLRRHGYYTAGAGKVFHGGSKFDSGDDAAAWDEFRGGKVLYGPFPPEVEGRKFPPVHPRQADWVSDERERGLVQDFFDPFWVLDGMLKFDMENGVAPIEDVPDGGWFHQYPDRPWRFESADDRDLLPDEATAEFAEEFLARPHDRPFFLALGFIRPHTPLFVPGKFFERFPAHEIELPVAPVGDLDDCSPAHAANRPYGRLRYEYILSSGERGWRETLQGYLASIAFMDEQLGRVLDAWEAARFDRPVVAIFTSDHGYHMGEKQSWFKDTLWEESTRVPLIIHAPNTGQQGMRCDAAVSLVDLYPTILELCGIEESPYAKAAATREVALDGESLAPLLRDPTLGSSRAVVTSVRGVTGIHHALRTERYRYILCEDGSEELYDHRTDPHEHTNLAGDPAFEQIRKQLRLQLERRLLKYGVQPASAPGGDHLVGRSIPGSGGGMCKTGPG